METGNVELQGTTVSVRTAPSQDELRVGRLNGITIVAPIRSTLQGIDERRNILRGVTVAVNTDRPTMQLRVADRNNRPIQGATCRVLNAIGGNNNVLSFDGVDDYVITNLNRAGYGTTFTISFWVNLFGSQSDRGIFQVASVLTSGNPWILLRRTNPTIVQWWLNSGYRISIDVPDNTWTHLALTFDGTIWRSFRNGEAQGTYIGAIGGTAANNTYFLNGWQGFLRGMITDFRVYTGARTQENIQSDLNIRLFGNESGLISYLPLNEGSGGTVSDLRGGFNGTIFGATWGQITDLSIGSQIINYTTTFSNGTTNADGIVLLNYNIGITYGLEVTLSGRRRFIMPFRRTDRAFLDWQVVLSDILATFFTSQGEVLINAEPENNDSNFLIS